MLKIIGMVGKFTGVNTYVAMGATAAFLLLFIWLGITKYQVSQLETAKALLEQKIIVQDFQISSLKDEIRVKDFTAKLLKEDKIVLDARRKEMQSENDKLNAQLEAINNEPSSQDGPVAPVLRNVLSSR